MARRLSRTQRERGADVLTYVALLAILLFFGGPLLWVLSLSVRTPAEVFITTLRLIPDEPTLDNFRLVLGSPRFTRYLLNSAQFAAVGSVGALLGAAPAAYAASRLRFRGKHSLMIGVLSLQMISPLVIMIPLYRYYANIGLLDTFFGAAMVYIAILMPLATWMLKDFFDAIPLELDEAARVDGCNRLSAFLRVILPLAVPGFSAVLVLTAILAWAEFIVPFILISDTSMTPISVGIFTFAGSVSEVATGVLAAGSILAILPAVLVFVALQRFVVSALTAGAVKG